MAEGDLLKNITESSREELRKNAEKTTGHKLLIKKIDEIGLYTRVHSYKFTTIEIGKYLDNRIAGCDNEEVGAIFESDSDSYVVCTANHGIEKGEPFIFRAQEIYEIVEER
ncbi:MAG: hypothetical protein ACE5JK_06475 [Candidatus Omnitrophota bacterium]